MNGYLWKIHYETGQVIIVGSQKTKINGFFDNDLKADKGKALQDAQKDTIKWLRKRNDKGVAHPYYWASFSLTGDWGVLRKNSTNGNLK